MTSPKYETSPSAGEDWMTWLHLYDLEGDQFQGPGDLSVRASTASSLDVNHSSVDELLRPQDQPQEAFSWEGTSVNADILRNDGGDSEGSCSLPSGLTQTNDSPFVHHDPGLRQAAFNTDYGVTSDSSVGSFDSFASSGSASVRRRRKKVVHSETDTTGQKARARRTASRRYQCTFCTDAFKTKYDWQRHETSMHLSLEQWKCSRFGPVIRRSDGRDYCVFCSLCDPSAEHSELHNYFACVAQPDEARLFYRKDHLQQHLRLFHRGCNFNDSMKGWLSYRDKVKSRCGFCNAHMQTWTERQKHLAAHFRMGADMKDWKGDRGFDQQVDDIVEDDIPVFLIGDQRRTMEPFSASREDHRSGMSVPNIPRPPSIDEPSLEFNADQVDPIYRPHSYRDTERALLKYVSDEISQGRVPSDSQLQMKMSEVMYGPGNMWDSTWADNPQWLEMFRTKAGLISLPLSHGKNAFVGFDATLYDDCHLFPYSVT